MTTPAKMALDWISKLKNSDDPEPVFDYQETIRAALKVLNEVQSVMYRGASSEDEAMCQVTSIYNDGYNHCLDHLKQIAGE